MFSNHRSTNKIVALFVFISALILYIITMAPTASFWDAGEFIAVAHGLQVNHPPGAPFYSLLGRLFSMFMPSSWVAVSINFISALASALTVMLLYLIIVRLVREFKGYAMEKYASIDRIGMHGGAVIGAFAFAVTDTFWFNAVEAEVYALSMFFTAIVVWLALKWSENHAESGNRRWLLLIAYMFGLALGVHLLNLLALFFVALIVYFKKREFGLMSLAIAGAVAVASFFLIYPFTVQWIPSIMDGIDDASYGLIGPVFFTLLVIAGLAGGIYFTHKKNYRTANFAILCYTLILIGYSSYALIFIRSTANPPIDENDPETAQAFIDYLERKQYGQTPLLTGNTYNEETGRISQQEESLFPRRYSASPQHLQQYGQYESDWDYFWSYQVNHMYIRYFNWNFVGRDNDVQNAGWQSGFTETENEQSPAHNSYFFLPFLLGLLGMIFHFQKDWKRALCVLALFMLTGLAIIIFLNQTPMQPRERDYAYVGSFFAFSIWIGMGGVGLVNMVKDYLKSSNAAAYALLGGLFLAVPFQMGWQNFNDHDRSDRYVAPDYAFNLLQSVDYQGIVFTNGDNDTFPLWYLQEVEGVRTDVRIVCLSLLNTDWYIKQLRDQWSHESAPLPISLTDDEIEELTKGYELHQPDTVRIPVNKDLLRSSFSASGEYRKAIGVQSDTALNVYEEAVDFGMPVDSLDSELAWYFEGRRAPGTDRQGNKRYYTQIQDEVIIDILKTNKWLRPVHFANTVSRVSQLGLQNYFRFEGKGFRVVPQRHENVSSFGWIDPEIMADTYRKFRFRKWNKPGNYLDENIRRMLGNYRYGITELANAYQEQNMPDSAAKWLKWGEERLPFNSVGGDNRSIVLYAYNYATSQDYDNAMRLALLTQNESLEKLESHLQKFDSLQQKIAQLTNQIKQARGNADISKQQQLQKKMQNISARRERIIRQAYSSIYNLVIVQRIYYLADQNEEAQNLIEKVNRITGQRIQFPQNEQENKRQIDQLL